VKHKPVSTEKMHKEVAEMEKKRIKEAGGVLTELLAR
tara:strand:- start:380 stop:490 length:111 start_codon:yes stop_codon:yes gene_type:complete